MSTRRRVLIVDDEADVARYLAAAVEDEGYDVLIASDAEEGTSLAHAERPDLVCLDLVMPGRTGLSLYRELRESPELAGVRIIVVTGVVAAEAADELGLGETLAAPDAFIEKPVDMPRLLEAIHTLLDDA
jgi:DNA-binding response OmpR family regulator